jgi:hypothetical protein
MAGQGHPASPIVSLQGNQCELSHEESEEGQSASGETWAVLKGKATVDTLTRLVPWGPGRQSAIRGAYIPGWSRQMPGSYG